ncbi:hypothetical protein G5B30_05845 [Sphingobacterium sp. SGG-5]|uniref:hypothetical protein n=1 Tax=Sphingobacterium sp. SGG-5 TaxID=2710881 RepID=UPI0013EC464B|nr:hypothetical protein [Sphingobacterium sp. SGG-5]NGM61440.1 hypothetical protein [Sphingobacterium sp. SGG-5]
MVNKYTINKAFEKSFPFPIWKIEVDCAHNRMAIEYRDPETTIPHFSVLDFDGNIRDDEVTTKEKEWTLEAIQGEFLVLKRFGASSPIEAGICIIHYPTNRTIVTAMEYVLQEVYQGILLARHRSIPGGLVFQIDIATGQITQSKRNDYSYPVSHIHYPIAYTANLPAFIREIPFVDQVWLLPMDDVYIWAYHLAAANKYNLILSLSTKNELLDTKVVLENLNRLIPQPFFQVERYIFFLSNTKQEIITYLV